MWKATTVLNLDYFFGKERDTGNVLVKFCNENKLNIWQYCFVRDFKGNQKLCSVLQHIYSKQFIILPLKWANFDSQKIGLILFRVWLISVVRTACYLNHIYFI